MTAVLSRPQCVKSNKIQSKDHTDLVSRYNSVKKTHDITYHT